MLIFSLFWQHLKASSVVFADGSTLRQCSDEDAVSRRPSATRANYGKHLEDDWRILLLQCRSGRFINPLRFLHFKVASPQACWEFEPEKGLGIDVGAGLMADAALSDPHLRPPAGRK